VTIVAAEGSSPREAGAKMLVTPNEFMGTIGGGGLEHRMLDEARQMISEQNGPARQVQDVPLGPDLGQCCGGLVHLVFERLGSRDLDWLKAWQSAEEGAVTREFRTPLSDPASKIWVDLAEGPRETILTQENGGPHMVEVVRREKESVWIFGAGHVAQALVPVLSGLDFDVTVVDERPEWLAKIDEAQASTVFNLVPESHAAHVPPGGVVLAMTHNHGLDFDICSAALRREDIAFVGMIGSASKRVQAVRHFTAQNVSEDALSRFVSPIGVGGVRDKRPAAIAVSVATQLLQFFAKQNKPSAALSPETASAGDE
jgi:xanthine dehydrogenase accessory factor